MQNEIFPSEEEYSRIPVSNVITPIDRRWQRVDEHVIQHQTMATHSCDCFDLALPNQMCQSQHGIVHGVEPRTKMRLLIQHPIHHSDRVDQSTIYIQCAVVVDSHWMIHSHQLAN